MTGTTVTLSEDQAIELMAYMLSSAQGMLKEPEHYAVLRMVSAADRMAAMWAPRTSGTLAEFLEDLSQRMPVESAATQGDDIASFERYLGQKLAELARIVKERNPAEPHDGA